MLPVEIVPVDGTTIVLRARGSELLILPHHIGQLKSCKNPKDFTGYFLTNALLNRPARKLFEAWLRKDKSLWQRIYRTVQNDMDTEKIKEFEERMSSTEAEATEKKSDSKPAKVEAKKKDAEEEPTKKVAAPTKAKTKAKDEEAEEPAKATKKKAAAPATAKKKESKDKVADKPKKDAKKAPAAKKAAAKPKKK